MDEAFLDLESVEVELDEELLDAIDDKAFADHRDNRDAAVRDLLDEWLKQRAVEDTDERD
jgi:Arc/MetJ-type ribon-helix-helix transcriptional regulator